MRRAIRQPRATWDARACSGREMGAPPPRIPRDRAPGGTDCGFAQWNREEASHPPAGDADAGAGDRFGAPEHGSAPASLTYTWIAPLWQSCATVAKSASLNHAGRSRTV